MQENQEAIPKHIVGLSNYAADLSSVLGGRSRGVLAGGSYMRAFRLHRSRGENQRTRIYELHEIRTSMRSSVTRCPIQTISQVKLVEWSACRTLTPFMSLVSQLSHGRGR